MEKRIPGCSSPPRRDTELTVSVAIVEREQDLRAWDAYVQRHPWSTAYHQRTWQAIFREGFAYRSFLLLASDASNKPCGALPLYLVASPLSRRLVGVPFRDRGGPLWDTEEAFHALMERAGQIALENRVGAVVLKTLQPFPDSFDRHGLARSDYWIHSVLALKGVDDQSLWSSIGGTTRNMVRQAERHGVTLRVATGDTDIARRWYALHLVTQRRLGVPPFPRHFFSTMLEVLRPTGGVEVIEALHENQPCSATLLLLHGKTCVYGYAASTAAGRAMRANDFLLHGAIRFAVSRGMDYFDLGSDSPLQEGLLFYKRKWGAVQSSIPVYRSGPTGSLPDSSASRYNVARTILRSTPAAVLEMLGTRFTRYLG